MNNDYNIEDLIGIDYAVPTCATNACENPYTNNNKQMNFIEKRKMENFLKGKKIETIEKAVDSANEKAVILNNIASVLQNMVGLINGDNQMLADAIDRADLSSIEAISAELEGKLEVVAEKEFADAIEIIAGLVGAKGAAVKADKKATKKAMGFVTKK